MDTGRRSGHQQYAVENSTVPQHLVTDKMYKAVQPLFKYKDGFERKNLLELLAYCYTKHGRGFKNTNSMFEYYYKLEDGIPLSALNIIEEHLETPTDSAGATDSIDANAVTLAATACNDRSPVNLTIDPAANISRPNPSNVPTSVGKEQKSTSPLNPELTCKVCLDAAVAVTFVPCGHLVTCRTCALGLVECPVCRTMIRGTVSTFF